MPNKSNKNGCHIAIRFFLSSHSQRDRFVFYLPNSFLKKNHQALSRVASSKEQTVKRIFMILVTLDRS